MNQDIRAAQLFSLVKRQSPLLRPLNPSAMDAACTRPALYCVHSLSGMLTEFLPLATLLDPHIRVFGFQVTSEALRDPEFGNSMLKMGDTYAECIMAAQPFGTVFLAGFSAGGVVAYDIAISLIISERKVGLIALLDTVPYADLPEAHLFNLPYLVAVARNFPHWLMHEVRCAPSCRRSMAQRVARKVSAPVGPIHRFIDLDAGYLPDHQAFIIRFFDGVAHYKPVRGVWRSMVVYEAMVQPFFRPSRAGRIWKRYASCVAVVRIRSTHNEMMHLPHVETIAADLATRIGG